MKKFFLLGLISIIVLSGCAAPAKDQEISSEEGGSPLVTVYRSPT